MNTNILIQQICKDELKELIEDIFQEVMFKALQSKKEKFLTVQQCAIKLNVSDLTIYNYIKKGWIPAKKIGRKYLIEGEAFENSLDEVKSLKYRRDV